MDIEANKAGSRVAEILKAEEVQAAVTAHHATQRQMWIAFAGLMLTLIILAVGGIFSYGQFCSQFNSVRSDVSDLKTNVHSMEGTVNLMAGRLGVQPQKERESNASISHGKEPLWFESFSSSVDPSPPSSCGSGRAGAGSDFATSLLTSPLSPETLPPTTKPSFPGCVEDLLDSESTGDASRSPSLTRLRW